MPQNPTTALNPGIRVGAQIDEILQAHGNPDPDKRVERTLALFELVGLPAKAEFLRRYPHQLSGGQQQRVCIAMALACDPAFVVLDEPTTGLDVTTQEQIVALLVDLRARLSMSMLYVTHDLGLLSQIADRVGVMYAGRMVEIAPTSGPLLGPETPVYTRPDRLDPAHRGSVRPAGAATARLAPAPRTAEGLSFRAALRLGAAALFRGATELAGRRSPA